MYCAAHFAMREYALLPLTINTHNFSEDTSSRTACLHPDMMPLKALSTLWCALKFQLATASFDAGGRLCGIHARPKFNSKHEADYIKSQLSWYAQKTSNQNNQAGPQESYEATAQPLQSDKPDIQRFALLMLCIIVNNCKCCHAY